MGARAGSPTFARRLGARIRALRVERGLTQEGLAWECELNKGYLSQVESGKHVPSIPVLVELAKRLHVEPADLLCFPTSRPRLALLDATRRGDRAAVETWLKRLDLR